MRFVLTLLMSLSTVFAGVIHRDLGHVNGFDINANGKSVGVYSAGTKSTRVLLTHHRRDLYSILNGRVIAPLAER